MFDLPKGITVEEEIDVSEGVIQPFTHGVISTWIGKRKTPAGHRIVRSGRVVGYLAESEKFLKHSRDIAVIYIIQWLVQIREHKKGNFSLI